MNTNDFAIELQNYFANRYNEVVDLQQKLLKMMDFFHGICEKKSIYYYLGFGSLLGSIRDKCIIPWDLDIDLLVRYEDKDRLITVLQKECVGEYRFICPEIDSRYEHFDMRIYIKGINHRLLHIDIFYLVNAPDDIKEFTKFASKMINLAQIRYRKLLQNKDENSKLRRLYMQTIHYVLAPIPLCFLNYKHRRLSTKFSNSETKTYFRTCLSKNKNLKVMYKKEWFDSIVQCEMNGRNYWGPCGYKEMLSTFFGKYLEYPSIINRANEFLGALSLIDTLHNRQETDHDSN